MAKRTVEDTILEPMEQSTTQDKKIKIISADSLEEDFLLEDDFVPGDYASGDEGDFVDTSAMLSDIEEDLPQSESTSVVEELGGKKKKRKLEASGSNRTEIGGDKKDKKVKKVKETFEENSISLGLLENEKLVDKIAEKQMRALPNLSPIEMDDLRITESMILDTSAIQDRKSLMSFIRDAVPTLPSTLAKPPKRPGAPRVIVLSGAALRVADLCREVKAYKTKDVDIAKLFSKHFKLPEHVEYLEKTKVAIAVGVPGRIGKLFHETEALSITHLSHLILDVTHIDSKQRSLLDLADSREDIFKFVLGHKPLMDRLREGRMKLVFW